MVVTFYLEYYHMVAECRRKKMKTTQGKVQVYLYSWQKVRITTKRQCFLGRSGRQRSEEIHKLNHKLSELQMTRAIIQMVNAP